MLKKLLLYINLADLTVFTYGILTIVLIFFGRYRLDNWEIILALHVSFLIAVAGIICAFHLFKSKFWKIIRYWYLLIVIMAAFRELFYLVPAISPIDKDNVLLAIDKAIFTQHPTVFFQNYLNPILTDFLQIIYSSFYFIPITLGLILYLKNKINKFEELMALTVIGFFSSYIGFYLLPAIGPRFTLINEHHIPLKGLFVTDYLRNTLDVLELKMRDCFPSGHTEVSLICMLYSYKISKKLFLLYLPWVTILIFSTIYLRYHYTIDIIVGIILALILTPIVLCINKKFVSLQSSSANNLGDKLNE